MNFISNIPYIFSLFASLIITIVSIIQGENFQSICVKISITIVVFYLLGLVIQKLVIIIIMDAIKHKQQIDQEMQKKQQEMKNEKQISQAAQDEEFSPMDYEHIDINQVKNN